MELIFERFEQIGTAHGVYAALLEDSIQIPVRNGRGERFRWRSPSPAAILRMLKNPMYAGAYVYGRHQVEEYLDEAQHPPSACERSPTRTGTC